MFIKNVPKDAALGGAFGLTSSLAEGDKAEDMLRNTAMGSVFGILVPPVVGTAVGAGIKTASAASRYAGRKLGDIASRLEVLAEPKPPSVSDVLKGTYYENVARNPVEAEKGTLQSAAAIGARVIRAGQTAKGLFYRKIVDKFSPVSELQRRLQDAGIDSGDLLESIQGAEYRGLGKAENKLDQYNAMREAYGDDWTNVKALAGLLDDMDRLAAGDVIPGKRTYADVEGDMAKIAQRLGPDRFMRIEEGQKKLQGFLDQELLDAVESGRIDADQYQAIKKAHPNYIPHRLIDAMDEGASDIAPGGSFQLLKSGIERTEGGTEKGIQDIDKSVVQTLIRQNRLNEVNKANREIFAAVGDKAEQFGFRPLRTAEKVRTREIYAQTLSDLRTGIAAQMRKVKSARRIDDTLVKRLNTLDREIEGKESKFYADLSALGVNSEDTEITRLLAERERDNLSRRELLRGYEFSNEETEGGYQKFRDLARHRPWMIESDIEQVRSRLRKSGMSADAVDGMFNGGEGSTDMETLDAFKKRLSAERNPPKVNGLFMRRVDAIESRLEKGEKMIMEKSGERTEIRSDRRALTNAIGELERKAKQLGQTKIDLTEDLKNYADVKVKARQAKKEGFETYKFFRDGVREEWLVPEDVGEALKFMDSQQSGQLIKFLDATVGMLARFKRGIATQYNPMFAIVSNPARDVQTAYATSGLALTMADFSKAAGVVRSAEKGVGADDLLKLAREVGALQGGVMREGREPAKILAAKNKVKRYSDGGLNSLTLDPLTIARKLGSVIEKAGEFQEQRTRIAVFSRALQEGMAPRQAAKVARQSTVDFGRGGSFAQMLNRYIPFLNARIQGFSNLAAAMERDPVGMTRKLMISAAWPATLLAAINSRWSSYQNIPDNEKRKYWIFMVGQTKDRDYNGKTIDVPYYIKVPKGEAQQAVSSAVERFLTAAQEKYPETTAQFFGHLVGDISPVTDSSVLPPGIQEWVELSSNYSMFRDKQIEGDYTKVGKKWKKTEELEPRRRSTDNTSILANMIGDLANWSPTKIDYAVKQGLVNDIVRGGDLAFRDWWKLKGKTAFQKAAELPFVRSVIGTSSYGTELRRKDAELRATRMKNERIIEKSNQIKNTAQTMSAPRRVDSNDILSESGGGVTQGEPAVRRSAFLRMGTK
ncbi:MAG: hypothetical protein PHT59_04100 [Candidatus Omnitrophica bacterium]|nr:hypothetical protein [Candidatus Omnitrophota bacterium]